MKSNRETAMAREKQRALKDAGVMSSLLFAELVLDGERNLKLSWMEHWTFGVFVRRKSIMLTWCVVFWCYVCGICAV